MPDEHALGKLWAAIESAKADLESSAGGETRDLLRHGQKLRKALEESAVHLSEAHDALAAGRATKDRVAHAAADLWYHMLVTLASVDVTPWEVLAALERRGPASQLRETR